MSGEGERHPLGRSCQIALPVALFLLPYALGRPPSKPPRKPAGTKPKPGYAA